MLFDRIGPPNGLHKTLEKFQMRTLIDFVRRFRSNRLERNPPRGTSNTVFDWFRQRVVITM